MTTKREIREVAREIKKEWKNVNFAAAPYLDAMMSLTDKNSKYMFDSATSVVLYFLSNASTFRGDKAKELKAELKAIIK